MEFFFYIVIAAIFGSVIFLAIRSVNEGMKARSELKRDGTLDKNKEDPYTFKSVEDDENDKILEKLKDKDLSPEDLKNLYDEIKRKKN
ncbi:hypothetical protein OAN82_02725 [Pelagibacteraceae bacterium]|nr:hypothetical protein [Pelagibacteraceae bacterium]MDC1158224.1 hypothetical protein [Pelagibacteraceae bacterium]